MPDWSAELRRRLSSVQLTATRENEIVDELSQHLQQLYDESIAGGASADEARQRALNEFESDEYLAKRLNPLRQAHAVLPLAPGEPTGSAFSDVWADVRYSWRQFIRQPAFTVTVVGTLAICLAANLSIFAVVDAVVLRPLPFPEPQRLVAIYNTYPGAGAAVAESSAMDFYDRRQLASLEGLATYRRAGLTVLANGTGIERLTGLVTTPSLFTLIGTRPLLGRLLLDSDAEPEAERGVLLTYGYWQRAFGGRSGAVGETLRIDGVSFTVVGVLPTDWRFIDPELQIVIPTAFTVQDRSPNRRHRNNNWLQVGRLASGATLETLQSQLDALNAANLAETPDLRQTLANIGFSTRAAPFQQFVVGNTARTLYFIWGGVLIVLLAGGVNLVNMMLVRSTARGREWATRLALGAGTARLVRQSVIECWLLTGAGAVIGVAISALLIKLAPSFGLDTLPRGTEVGLDFRVFAYLIVIALVVGTALATMPFVAFRPATMLEAIRDEGRTGTASLAARVARRLLASAQIACAVMLLIAGGAMVASLQRVLDVDLGFNSDRVLTAQLNLPAAGYVSRVSINSMIDRVLTRFRQIPGVEAVGVASTTPFAGSLSNNPVLAEGYEMGPTESLVSVNHVSVSDGYFETIGARIIEGRDFDAADLDGRRNVVIIDERLARKFFSGGSAIGRRIWTLRGTERIFEPPPEDQMLTIVGVIAEMRLTGVVDAPGVHTNGVCYYPFRLQTSNSVGVAIRTVSSPTEIVGDLRRALAELDPKLPLYSVDTLDNLIDSSLMDRRTPTLLAVTFAAVALLLATIGVYSVVAYQVSQRRREIGIRMALGADSMRIFLMVLIDGGLIIGVGIAAGLAFATLTQRIIESQLYLVAAMDGRVVLAVISTLTVVALLAIIGPARRAARTSPSIALVDA